MAQKYVNIEALPLLGEQFWMETIKATQPDKFKILSALPKHLQVTHSKKKRADQVLGGVAPVYSHSYTRMQHTRVLCACVDIGQAYRCTCTHAYV